MRFFAARFDILCAFSSNTAPIQLEVDALESLSCKLSNGMSKAQLQLRVSVQHSIETRSDGTLISIDQAL
jgi:hypothetical protein